MAIEPKGWYARLGYTLLILSYTVGIAFLGPSMGPYRIVQVSRISWPQHRVLNLDRIRPF